MDVFRDRIRNFQMEMKEHEADLAIIGPGAGMRYLTGWTEEGHERLLTLMMPDCGDPVFLIPEINRGQASTNRAGLEKVVGWTDAHGWERQAISILDGWGLLSGACKALVGDEFPAAHLLVFQRLLPSVCWEAAGPLLGRLRQRKSAEELESLRCAAAQIDEIVVNIASDLREGVSEAEIQEQFRAEFARRGTTESFVPLICFGANGAIPHHHSGSDRLKRGDVVVLDVGCRCDDYCSDTTRTFSYGEPADPDAAAVYKIVYEAHMAARAAARPRVSTDSVDAAARNVITRAGYGDYFIHRTGHGIGLSEHEFPYIVSGSAKRVKPGMTFSIEPGIYLPGRFGVRIENIVVMTDSGVVSLNAEPPADLPIL